MAGCDFDCGWWFVKWVLLVLLVGLVVVGVVGCG